MAEQILLWNGYKEKKAPTAAHRMIITPGGLPRTQPPVHPGQYPSFDLPPYIAERNSFVWVVKVLVM